jgi:hypothetical protein
MIAIGIAFYGCRLALAFCQIGGSVYQYSNSKL